MIYSIRLQHGMWAGNLDVQAADDEEAIAKAWDVARRDWPHWFARPAESSVDVLGRYDDSVWDGVVVIG